MLEAMLSVRADDDPFTAAYRTGAEAPLKRCGVGKRISHLRNLFSAIKREVRCDASIAVGISPASKQQISHSIGSVHGPQLPQEVYSSVILSTPQSWCDNFISFYSFALRFYSIKVVPAAGSRISRSDDWLWSSLLKPATTASATALLEHQSVIAVQRVLLMV